MTYIWRMKEIKIDWDTNPIGEGVRNAGLLSMASTNQDHCTISANNQGCQKNLWEYFKSKRSGLWERNISTSETKEMQMWSLSEIWFSRSNPSHSSFSMPSILWPYAENWSKYAMKSYVIQNLLFCLKSTVSKVQFAKSPLLSIF